MEELFNKPILDQMYEFRKEDFEQSIYDNNAEIKEIENGEKCFSENLTKKLKTKYMIYQKNLIIF